MNVKKLWLDLELREDVDDFFTLIYALENNFPIEVISISEPSINEMKLVNYALTLFNRKDIPFVRVGDITERETKKDLNPFLLSLCSEFEPVEINTLNNFIYDVDIGNMTVFCGGSLMTLGCLTYVFNEYSFEALIQGGFAGEKVVGDENTLKKFKGRDKVPSWNLNIDLESTELVLDYKMVKRFVSKNICHDSFVHKNDLIGVNSIFAKLLRDFFKTNKFPDKCMHDLLALLSVVTDDLIEFIPVDLKCSTEDNGAYTKWWSEENLASDVSISKSFDKELFLKLITVESE